MHVSERNFLKECIKKILIKNKWTKYNLYSLDLFRSALNINYVGTIYWIFLPSWFQLAWWLQRRRLKCKSLRTMTDAKWWLYIAQPFGSSELIRCYQTSHLFRHRGTRNVLPTDVQRAVGLIAATEHTCWSHAL